MAKGFISEMVSARSKKNPQFPRLLAEAEYRRKVAKRLTAKREKKGLSQTVVAALMGTSPSVVCKLEAGGDVRLSTLQRYCAAIGEALDIR